MLWERIVKEQPKILCLQETKCVGDEALQILTKCWKQARAMETNAISMEGGLSIL
jgi:hypothetical protein